MLNRLKNWYNEDVSDSFGNWLADQIGKRGWTHNELARRAGVSQPAVSGIVAGRRPSADFCIKVAQALGEPPEKILRLAGILPPSEDDSALAELYDLVRNLPLEQRQEALRYLRFLYQQRRS